MLSFCREEATRTPDPYVPNVVRYQLRYFSLIAFARLFAPQIFSVFDSFCKSGCKGTAFFSNHQIILHFLCNYFALLRLKGFFPGVIGSFLAINSRISSSVAVSGRMLLGN